MADKKKEEDNDFGVDPSVPRWHEPNENLSPRAARLCDLAKSEAEQNWTPLQGEMRSLMDPPTRRPAGPLS